MPEKIDPLPAERNTRQAFSKSKTWKANPSNASEHNHIDLWEEKKECTLAVIKQNVHAMANVVIYYSFSYDLSNEY